MRHTHQDTVPVLTHVAAKPSDRDICDAYLYLLGRLLVLRQEQLDFRTGDFRWNLLVHRAVGGVAWANPNLDVAYSEAWLAVDDSSCTILDVPRILNRYYTIQLLDMWGETIVNINERTYPYHPSGPFAFCLRDAQFALPAGMQRIDVPGRKARMLIRIELGADAKQTILLQHGITMRTKGSPRIASTLDVPHFTNDKLPGVEAFDTALAVMGTERDRIPGSDALQAKVRAVAASALDIAERDRIDRVIREQAFRELARGVADAGTVRNGWMYPRVTGRYGDDWLGRTVANLTGIWSNTHNEVVYFGAGLDSPLSGSDTYTMTFDKDNMPSEHVQYFWSVSCVDATNYRVIPNAKNRFTLGSHSPLQPGSDGSLTLYFAAKRPSDAPEANWLPTPASANFMLTWRSYGPDNAIVSGDWFPPPLVKRA